LTSRWRIWFTCK